MNLVQGSYQYHRAAHKIQASLGVSTGRAGIRCDGGVAEERQFSQLKDPPY